MVPWVIARRHSRVVLRVSLLAMPAILFRARVRVWRHFDRRDVFGNPCDASAAPANGAVGDLHVDTREWFYVSAYLQCRLYCFGHEFVYFGHFDRRDMFG